MAARGLVYTGGTGEDYAVAGRNAVVLETLEPEEIVDRAEQLTREPRISRRLRAGAYRTAHSYSWRSVGRLLLARLEAQARTQGLIARS
jgi:hypothetical protein